MATTITIAIVALILGYFIAKVFEKKKASSTLKNVQEQAATILKEAKIEAEGIKKDKILQAKEKFIELKSEHEKVILSRDKKIGEAENLFVPVCLSASHVAHGSIRMEPQFMMLGQAAALAAILAMEENTSVQSVDYARLSDLINNHNADY